ncbi:Putative ankyrin repeat protein MM_0045 [Geodia barretti]|uniref:Ankyrin repeat protein MM_0045 n=1 Tax=Geodia barretti TaxID=519541 RepID=A0AA35TZG6_GEOBA|nr:Putative ankyrin repeat protein MM_0045 [Geodia barretti]
MKGGAHIDIQDERGDSLLMKAASESRTEVVSLLLKVGANIDLQNERGDSAVILATVKFHLSVLKVLVRAGADLNLQNQEMLTALMISSTSARTDLSETLLSGPNICLDIQSNGLTALYFATAGVHKDVYELLKRHMRSPSVSWQSRVSEGMKDLVKGGRQAAKQAFIRLETRVLRPDKTKQLESGVRAGQEEGEGGVRRKPKPHPQEHSTRDEYWSSLDPQ